MCRSGCVFRRAITKSMKRSKAAFSSSRENAQSADVGERRRRTRRRHSRTEIRCRARRRTGRPRGRRTRRPERVPEGASSPKPGSAGKSSNSIFPAARPSTWIRACSRIRSYEGWSAARGLPGERQRHRRERRHGVDAMALQFLDLNFCRAGDEREMIVRSPPRVASLPPAADVAIFARIGIGRRIAAGDRFRQAVADAPVIGAVVVHPEGLRRIARMRRDHVGIRQAARPARRRGARRRGRAAKRSRPWFRGRVSRRRLRRTMSRERTASRSASARPSARSSRRSGTPPGR